MKKLTQNTIAILLTLTMVLTAGCGGSDDNSSSKKNTSESERAVVDENLDAEANGEDSVGFDDIYYGADLIMGDTAYSCLEMGMTPENTNVVMHGKNSCTLTMGGFPTEFDIKDGKMCVSGQALYDIEIVSKDEIKIDMQGSVYRFYRKDSELASAAGLFEGATGPDPSEEKPKYRDLIYGETAMEIDGGIIYYQTDPDGVSITYAYMNTKDFYVPEEIDGEKVYYIRNIHGHIENLYLPNSITEISSNFGDFEGLKTLTIGYGEGESQFKRWNQCGSEHGHFLREDMVEITFPESMVDNEEFKMKHTVLLGCQNLKTVNNMPPIWKEGIDSIEAATKMLNGMDPSHFISTPSAKVSSLAKEVTKDCTTDREKVYEISKWICENVTYDWEGFMEYCNQAYAYYYGKEYDGDPDPVKWIEPDEVIEHKLTVCSGYSKLTKAMCNAVGIPAVYVTGPISTMDEVIDLHAWNMVYIDGVWENIDNTWSDPSCNDDPRIHMDEEFRYLYDEGKFHSEITYEMYMENEELQEAYTWEELDGIQEERRERISYDANHAYFCMPTLIMGVDHIARTIDGIPVK